MHVTPICTALSAIIALQGCATTETYRATAEDRCLLAGYRPGSTEYLACARVVSENLAHQHNSEIATALLVGSAGAALIGVASAPRIEQPNTVVIYR